jgi:hypothetical protein
MSTTAALPPSLRDQLTATARRLRLVRLLRGLSLLVLIALLTGSAALLADAWLDLVPEVREACLIAWIGLAAFIFLANLLTPLARHLDPAALAAVIEEKYPDLGERLTSTVELAGDSDPYHGSPTLIALLLQETEGRSRDLNFRLAFPIRATGWLATGALALLALTLVPVLFQPEWCAARAERFLFPWRVAPTVAPYELEVSPGDAFAALGRPLTFAVHVRPRFEFESLPQRCVLVRTDAAGQAERLGMVADRSDAFSLRMERVPGDFTYRVEAEEAVSPDYQVTAIEPVEVATDTTSITITPPAYAKTAIETETIPGLADLSALQYSKVAFDFHFTRPAVAATLTWIAKDATARQQPLSLTADRRAGRLELPADADGTYQLVLEAEQGIRTELEPRSLSVRPDQPPDFLKVTGGEDLRTIQPHESLPLDIHLADDVGIATAQLEYRINGKTAGAEPIKLKGQGTREALGHIRLELSGKVQEGDEVTFRLQAADNRKVPEAGLGPHIVYYPPESAPGKPRWRTLKIARHAEPLGQQNVLAQRDDIHRRIDAIRHNLLQERVHLIRVRTETVKRPALVPLLQRALGELRSENQAADNDLRELARVAGETPGLQPIADVVKQIADTEIARSDRNLSWAEREHRPNARDGQLQNADRELSSAVRKLEELTRANERLAQDRLDQLKLERLAARQQQLAERAADQASRDPIKDAKSKEQARQIERDQAELADEVRKQAEQSETLRNALDAARSAQANKLAQQARNMAQAQRDLTQAARDNEERLKREQWADVARKQNDLADEADRLARDTRQSARTAQANPLRPDEARKAAESLRKGDAAAAMQQQDQAARELDRLAGELSRAAELARDPREAARQLARLQEDLRQRAWQAPKKDDPTLPSEQKAIRDAAQQLSVPPDDKIALTNRQEAADKAGKATDALERHDRAAADQHMTRSRQALERLAARLPSLEQRQRAARDEVAKLRRQQAEVAREAEQAVRKVESENPADTQTRDRLAKEAQGAAQRQAQIADRLGQLDTPRQEVRRERAQQALQRAQADLKDGRSQDVGASQEEARRELERLEQALAGVKPADERARDLARTERQIAAEAERQAANPKGAVGQAELQRRQQEVAREAQALPASEAPQQHAEAMEAARQANEAAQRDPASPAAREQMRQASRALQRLAQQLGGQESDAARADRLAKRQTAEAERLAKKSDKADAESQRRQKEITREAKQIRGGAEAQAEKQRALQALSRAQQADRPAEQAQARRQAADALQALADRLAGRSEPHDGSPDDKPTTRTSAKFAEQPSPDSADAASQESAPLAGLPQRDQAVRARQLAHQQRELRNAVRWTKEAPPTATARPRPVADMVQRQEAIAREASELAAQLEQDKSQPEPLARQAQQAARAAQQTSNQLQAGALKRALEAGQDSAQQLRSLSQQADPKAPEASRQSRELTGRQTEVNQLLEAVAEDGAANQAQQQARQGDLRGRAGEMANQLNRLGEQMGRMPGARQAAQQAAQASQRAQQAMQQAQDPGRQGTQAQAAQKQAAAALDQAAQLAAQAGRPMSMLPPPAVPSGEALQQAQEQIAQAQQQLAQQRNQGAQAAMQKAAQALQQAAQQLAPGKPGQPQPNSQPAELGVASQGRPDPSLLGKDMQQYAGKPWGELPGQLRTKIIQDMKEKYGDDYARRIKLYFEQIADKK